MSCYDQLYDKEELELEFGKHILKLACCDCGLIHHFNIFKGKRGHFKISVETDRKATAVYRRHNKKGLTFKRRKK